MLHAPGDLREDFAFTLPNALSDEAGALIEPHAVGLCACRKGRVGPGWSVLVTGAGPIGQLAMQAAFACGATDVTITDVRPAPLELALRTGARAAIDVSQTSLADAEVEADILLECSGNESALREGVMCLRPAGAVVVVGIAPADEVAVPMTRMRHRELTLTATFRYANAYPAAIDLAAAGRVDLDAIVTDRFPLGETRAALEAARANPATVKPMVAPGDA